MIRQSQSALALLSAAFLLSLIQARPGMAQDKGVDAMCVLEEHNALRASVGSPNLRWSEPLARQASGWANTLKKEGCGMKHSHAAKAGENLYWASPLKTGTRSKGKSAWKWSVTIQPITGKDVVASWATEKQWYSQATNSCDAPPGKTCGHYTQLVWETTREIGCGKAICDDSSQIWVCNYAPAGNVAGQRPY